MVRIISGGIKVKMKFFIQFPEKVRRRGPVIRFTGKHYIHVQIDHILSLSVFGIVFLKIVRTYTLVFLAFHPVISLNALNLGMI